MSQKSGKRSTKSKTHRRKPRARAFGSGFIEITGPASGKARDVIRDILKNTIQEVIVVLTDLMTKKDGSTKATIQEEDMFAACQIVAGHRLDILRSPGIVKGRLSDFSGLNPTPVMKALHGYRKSRGAVLTLLMFLAEIARFLSEHARKEADAEGMVRLQSKHINQVMHKMRPDDKFYAILHKRGGMALRGAGNVGVRSVFHDVKDAKKQKKSSKNSHKRSRKKSSKRSHKKSAKRSRKKSSKKSRKSRK